MILEEHEDNWKHNLSFNLHKGHVLHTIHIYPKKWHHFSSKHLKCHVLLVTSVAKYFSRQWTGGNSFGYEQWPQLTQSQMSTMSHCLQNAEIHKPKNKLLNKWSLSFWVHYNRDSFGSKTNAEFPQFYSGEDWRPRNQQSGVHFTAIFPFRFWAGEECIDTKPSVVVLQKQTGGPFP